MKNFQIIIFLLFITKVSSDKIQDNVEKKTPIAKTPEEKILLFSKIVKITVDFWLEESKGIIEDNTKMFIRGFRRQEDKLMDELNINDDNTIQQKLDTLQKEIWVNYEKRIRKNSQSLLKSAKTKLRQQLRKFSDSFEKDWEKVNEKFNAKINKYFKDRVELIKERLEVQKNFQTNIYGFLNKSCEEWTEFNKENCEDFLAFDTLFDLELVFPNLIRKHQFNEPDSDFLRKSIRDTKIEIVNYQQNIIDIQNAVKSIKENKGENENLNEPLKILNNNIEILVGYVDKAKEKIKSFKEQLVFVPGKKNELKAEETQNKEKFEEDKAEETQNKEKVEEDKVENKIGEEIKDEDADVNVKVVGDFKVGEVDGVKIEEIDEKEKRNIEEDEKVKLKKDGKVEDEIVTIEGDEEKKVEEVVDEEENEKENEEKKVEEVVDEEENEEKKVEEVVDEEENEKKNEEKKVEDIKEDKVEDIEADEGEKLQKVKEEREEVKEEMKEENTIMKGEISDAKEIVDKIKKIEKKLDGIKKKKKIEKK